MWMRQSKGKQKYQREKEKIWGGGATRTIIMSPFDSHLCFESLMYGYWVEN